MLGVGEHETEAIASNNSAAASASISRSGSGGEGELDKSKTVVKGWSKREVIDGGRDGLIGGDGNVIWHGREHGHGHHRKDCSPHCSSPSVASTHLNTVPLSVILTTTTTTIPDCVTL